jgi:hypothetical protein
MALEGMIELFFVKYTGGGAIFDIKGTIVPQKKKKISKRIFRKKSKSHFETFPKMTF